MPRQSTPAQIEARFWAKVDRTGDCWLWTANRSPSGYGKVTINGRFLRAHRVAYAWANGPIPAGWWVCHRCDTPSCVRAAHLFLGTDADNSRDRDRKARQAREDRSGRRLHPERWNPERHGSRTHPESRPRGEGHANATLTQADVETIRALYATGVISQSGIARWCGQSTTNVSAIVRGEAWRAHLPKTAG